MITTEIDKHKIKSSFSKAALKYDTFASLQKEVAEELLNSFVSPLTTHHSPLFLTSVAAPVSYHTIWQNDFLRPVF